MYTTWGWSNCTEYKRGCCWSWSFGRCAHSHVPYYHSICSTLSGNTVFKAVRSVVYGFSIVVYFPIDITFADWKLKVLTVTLLKIFIYKTENYLETLCYLKISQTIRKSHFIVKYEYPSIHPFSIPASFQFFLGRSGLLEPIPAVKWREAGYTLNRSPAYRRGDIWIFQTKYFSSK